MGRKHGPRPRPTDLVDIIVFRDDPNSLEIKEKLSRARPINTRFTRLYSGTVTHKIARFRFGRRGRFGTGAIDNMTLGLI